MGEAKRRKQLGLMPVVENRELILNRDGQMTGDPLPEAVLERLKTWAETGERWDARYRTSFIGTGLPRELLKTEDELMDIPVPERMRLRLGLLSGSSAWLERELEHSPDAFFEENGQRTRQLNVRATEYDYNGQWAALPDFEPDEALRYLMQHPAVMAPPQGSDYAVTVWHGGERAGEVDFDPGPDAEHQEALARAARVLLGESDQEWLEDHQGLLGEELDEANEVAPLARRSALMLSPVPLVLSPGVQILGQSGDMNVVASSGPSSDSTSAEQYSHDGQTWHDYPEPKDRDAQLQAMLAQMGLGDLSELQGLLGQGAGEDGAEPLDDRTIEAEVVERKTAESQDDAL